MEKLLLDQYLGCVDTQLPQLPQGSSEDNFNALFAAVQILAAQVSRASYFPCTCSVDMPVGTYVAIVPVSGAAELVPADGNSVDLFAVGFLTTTGVTGSTAIVCSSGINTYASGLWPGSLYYLSQAAPGTITSTIPISGIVQQLGVALTSDKLVTALVQLIR